MIRPTCRLFVAAACMCLLLPCLVSCAGGRLWYEWSSRDAAGLNDDLVGSRLYKGFRAGELPAGLKDDLVARLDFSKSEFGVEWIDKERVTDQCGLARVLPGVHEVRYHMYGGEFGHNPSGMIELEFKAGHLYEFRIAYCFWCTPRRYAVWVDDKTTGELVWGKHPDWPSWWL